MAADFCLLSTTAPAVLRAINMKNGKLTLGEAAETAGVSVDELKAT